MNSIIMTIIGTIIVVEITAVSNDERRRRWPLQQLSERNREEDCREVGGPIRGRERVLN